MSKKLSTIKSPSAINDLVNQVKVENVKILDDPKDGSPVKPKIGLDKKPDSPLRSVENVGKENRHTNALTWASCTLISPSRVNKSGYISTKSPRSRLSLSKPFKPAKVELAKKSVKGTAVDVSKYNYRQCLFLLEHNGFLCRVTKHTRHSTLWNRT